MNVPVDKIYVHPVPCLKQFARQYPDVNNYNSTKEDRCQQIDFVNVAGAY